MPFHLDTDYNTDLDVDLNERLDTTFDAWLDSLLFAWFDACLDSRLDAQLDALLDAQLKSIVVSSLLFHFVLGANRASSLALCIFYYALRAGTTAIVVRNSDTPCIAQFH